MLSQATMGDNSKPIDIDTNNLQSLTSDQKDSLSAYASAESSPSQLDANQMPKSAYNVDMRLVDEPYLNCIQTTDASSSGINTYWGLPPASSLLIDEEDKKDALEHSRLSQSKSFCDTNETTKHADAEKEYQSLPTLETKPLIPVDSTAPQSDLKKELSQSDLFKLQVVEGEEDLVSVELTENASAKTSELPEMSVPKSKSGTMAFIEKMFKGSATKTEVSEKSAEKPSKEEEAKKAQLNVALSSAAASASSPNPECSPYKFLLNEAQTASTEQKAVSSLSLKSAKGEKEQTASSAGKGKKNGVVVEKIIENLASLTRKDSEEHDPILSGAAASSSSAKETKTKEKNEKKSNKTKAKSPSKSVSSLPSALGKNQTAKMDNVPASSREFTMNLNFNLASAAAATAGGPVVVVDHHGASKSPVAKEHNKFTSNASTSSIHNDLKMILEESKEEKTKKQASGKENKKLNKSTDKKDKPLPQRQKKENKNNTSKSNNTSFNTSSAAETTSNSLTVETGNMSPTSKTNSLNLIKMMMLMVDNNNSKKHGGNNRNKMQSFNKNLEMDEPSNLIEMTKQNGRYKYSREFLMDIRDQRSKFIDQIQPEVFKAYCYCMNGKYWDPEKYFDIVQFPGDYERIQANRNNNRNTHLYAKSAGSKYTKSGKYTPNGTFNNSHSKMNTNGTTPNSAPNNHRHMSEDNSPQPLQVPKNSPKFVDAARKESSVQSILESLGLNTDHITDKTKLDADKILLGLIKKDKKGKTDKASDLMEIINKSSQSPNLLDNLLSKQQTQPAAAAVQKHYPLVLTAQELEMSQLSQQEKYKLPNEISMTKLEELQQCIDSNDSFAYKQLVKNLSNHPLNSATALNNKLEASLAKLQNKQKLESNKNKPTWQVSNDGTNMLKQMLNLKSESKKGARSTGYKSSNSSFNDSDEGKFPAVNPHEKPFEASYTAEDNRKQIEHIVASALSHVLSKSPSSSRQQPASPKSPIESLIEKINIKHKEQDLQATKQEHFNSLLNKMGGSQRTQPESKNESDILRWFSDAKSNNGRNMMSAHSLSEIESMQMHQRPVSTLNRFF